MIAELIERLEKAEIGSADLDAAMLLACGYHQRKVPMDSVPCWATNATGYPLEGVLDDLAEKPTQSLDAALSLVERRGWRPYTLDASIRGRFSWMLASQDQRALTDDEGREYMGTAYASGVHSTPALAVCLALLRALSTEA